jgi:hypothetical protein
VRPGEQLQLPAAGHERGGRRHAVRPERQLRLRRYSKAGSVLRGATAINQLWAGTDSECAIHNDGDPVVAYDQLAKRWLISEFIALPDAGEQYGEGIAISKTGDATGA